MQVLISYGAFAPDYNICVIVLGGPCYCGSNSMRIMQVLISYGTFAPACNIWVIVLGGLYYCGSNSMAQNAKFNFVRSICFGGFR